jgi:hypothetical protein
MLKPLRPEDVPQAAAALALGFPHRDVQAWVRALQLLAAHADNARTSHPPGWLMWHEGQVVGVMLTPATWREHADGSRETRVNLSSWTLHPDHRWRAAVMWMGTQKEKTATYLDLTPSAEVQGMLKATGFSRIGLGLSLAFTPALALQAGRGAHVRPLRPDDALPPGSPPMAMLMSHRALGCEPLVVESADAPCLLAYRCRIQRRLRVARLEYIGSHLALHRHLPALARYLLRRGVPFIGWDTRAGEPRRWGTQQRPGAGWYAKGNRFEDRTDFIGTESCILGV